MDYSTKLNSYSDLNRRVLLVTEESNSSQNGKNIYREVAKYAKDVKNKDDFVLIQDLQDFLRDLRALAVPRFKFRLVRVRNQKENLEFAFL